MQSASKGLNGRTVAVFESRRAPEMARLVERYGGVPLVAPTMKEVALEAGPHIVAFADALRAGEVGVLVLLTGVGTRALVIALASVMTKEEFRDLISKIPTFARGPKTVAALKELGATGYIVAPEPFTWEDLLLRVKENVALAGKQVAIQQYGVEHPELTTALEAEGARVMQVPVYRWHLPDDLAPIHAAIDALLANRVSAALFTSAQQVDHLLQVADLSGRRASLEQALREKVLLGSIGPTCTERLQSLGFEPDFEPAHSHMGHLVKELAERIDTVQKRTP